MAWKYLTHKVWAKDEAIPTIEGLAVYLSISRDSLYANDAFSDILEAVRTLQAKHLITGSLRNELNPAISKMMLSAKHGYVEKSEKALTGKDGGAIAFVDMASDDGEG
jgi:hypothetical protein